MYVGRSKVTERTLHSRVLLKSPLVENPKLFHSTVLKLLQALYTISHVKIIFIKEKWLQYSSAKGQLPLHLNKGWHKSFRTEGKFKYLRK